MGTSAYASAQWGMRGRGVWLAEDAENAEERCTSVHRTAVRGEGREEEKEEKRGG